MNNRYRFPPLRTWLLLCAALLCPGLSACQGGNVKQDPCDPAVPCPPPPAKRGIPLAAEEDPCCPGQPKKKLTPREGDRPFRVTSCEMKQDVRDLFIRVPSASVWQWNKIAQKLINFGSGAVPQVAANLESGVERVPVMAAFVLGRIGDPRALDALAQATTSADSSLRYEAATAMVRMGDRRGLPVLIDGLEERDPLVRARAILVLADHTGGTKGYKADDRPDERAAATARWRAWYQRTGGAAGR